MSNELETIRQKITPVLKRYPITYAGVFGSFARGEQTPESDIDILIRIEPNASFSLFDLVGVENSLKNTLGKEVDVCTEKSISKYIRRRVLNDLQPIYSI